jgi:hypothetical protein
MGEWKVACRGIVGNIKERDHLEGLVIDGRIILKWIFKKWVWEIWTGLIWIRIRTGGGRL